ncbi:hypothetical protein P2G88_06740 [Aliiglaciecola sp. CAU 1673]|uniref:hypothetical protein n=1 Tax=Aliiglaciecola sp. CAU 1673 TaxID=3032595 RepID=UPI0023DC1876|nr:hypothetical protein [Aliiglaciecola sp. CAU 1673]MDF2177944.1 hypothetical protein [Aliiglaciecola sp. CAU 1673]
MEWKPVGIINVNAADIVISSEARDAFLFTQELRFLLDKLTLTDLIDDGAFVLPMVVKSEDKSRYEVFANWLPLLPQRRTKREQFDAILCEIPGYISMGTVDRIAWGYATQLVSLSLSNTTVLAHVEELFEKISTKFAKKLSADLEGRSARSLCCHFTERTRSQVETHIKNLAQKA